MSTAWVACSVRARAMTHRRLGRVATRELARSASLDDALGTLVHSPYGHDVRVGQSLAEAQRAVVATTLWNLRVLAGWSPPDGVAMLRVLLGALEAANAEDHLRRLAGAGVPEPYRLGGLGTAWNRLAVTTTPAEVRAVLRASAWGDPGGETPRAIGLAMRLSLADRVMAAVPVAGEWAAGSAALLVAREVVLERRDLPERARASASRVIGPGALAARTLAEFVLALPATARWALTDTAQPLDLWAAEARWWTRVAHDGFSVSHRVAAGPEGLVGVAALLAADAWRTRAALEFAARGGRSVEVFDALA